MNTTKFKENIENAKEVAGEIYIDGYQDKDELPMSDNLVITLEIVLSQFNGSFLLFVAENQEYEGYPASDSDFFSFPEPGEPIDHILTQPVKFKPVATIGTKVQLLAIGAFLGGEVGSWKVTGKTYTLVAP